MDKCEMKNGKNRGQFDDFFLDASFDQVILISVKCRVELPTCGGMDAPNPSREISLPRGNFGLNAPCD